MKKHLSIMNTILLALNLLILGGLTLKDALDHFSPPDTKIPLLSGRALSHSSISLSIFEGTSDYLEQTQRGGKVLPFRGSAA